MADVAHHDESAQRGNFARRASAHGVSVLYATLANANLMGANFTNAQFEESNLSGSDMRGALNADLYSIADSRLANTILPDGTVATFVLQHCFYVDISEEVVCEPLFFQLHDHDGGLLNHDAISVNITGGMRMAGGTLQLLIEADPWDSVISFEPCIPVELGGTLQLTFADDVDVATQVGRTLDLFDWTGVNPTGQFQVVGPYAWDLAKLYTTGEVTLLGPALPGDVDFDGQLTAHDIDSIANAVRAGSTAILWDVNHDSHVDLDDHRHWVHDLKRTWFGDANLDGVFDSGDLVQVFQIGQYEDNLPGNSTWSIGDWNADGEFNTSDLVLAFPDGGYEQGPRVAVREVPEPTGGVLALLGGWWIAAGGRRRRTRRRRCAKNGRAPGAKLLEPRLFLSVNPLVEDKRALPPNRRLWYAEPNVHQRAYWVKTEMATDFEAELDAFHEFVASKLGNGSDQMSLEKAVHEFRAYQSQLGQFKQDTKAALEESARGESSLLGIEDVVERGKRRLAERGLTD